MKKTIILISLTLVIILTACSNKEIHLENTSTTDNSVTEDNMNETTNNEVITDETALEITDDTAAANAATDTVKDTVADPSKVDSATNTASDEEDKETAFSVSDTIPFDYLITRTDQIGSIQHISYQTYDYFGNGAEITKYAYVYLPYNYDESKQYNVLFLMHGIGGNEKEWGMYNDSSKVKIMMDNLIYNGVIDPFIVVVPNGRSSIDFANTSSDYNSFYLFGQELRNDLIPYIDSTFSTYAEYDENGYDLSAARDHRAMAGLSMGGMQTINIGMCESLDMISYFGAFSACPTTYSSSKIASVLKDYPDYDIHFFYNICGTEDGVAIASASSAVSSLTSLTDKLTDGENFIWQTVKGGHDFNIWYLGFYNFANIVFQ